MPMNNHEQAQALFVAKRQYQELSQSNVEPALTFSDLYQLATGTSAKDTQLLMARVNSSVTLRRKYLNLAKQCAYDHSKAQVSASSELDMPTRLENKFRLEFIRDDIAKNQVYVVLTVHFPTENQTSSNVTLNVESDEEIHRIVFPSVIDNKTQRIFLDNTPELMALCNESAEIYVMS